MACWQVGEQGGCSVTGFGVRRIRMHPPPEQRMQIDCFYQHAPDPVLPTSHNHTSHACCYTNSHRNGTRVNPTMRPRINVQTQVAHLEHTLFLISLLTSLTPCGV